MIKLSEQIPLLLFPVFLASATGTFAGQENQEETLESVSQNAISEHQEGVSAEIQEEITPEQIEIVNTEIEEDDFVVEQVSDAGLFPEDPSSTRLRLYYQNDKDTVRIDSYLLHTVQWGEKNKYGHTEVAVRLGSNRKK